MTDRSQIERAAEILRAGGLVAFPTETVYGLGADASNAQAVSRIYAVKGRPAEHPVIVHFDSAERAFAWARELPEVAHRLAEKFWPGPLTLIVKRAAHVGDFVTGGEDAVGLRVPSHPVAHELLATFAELKGDARAAGVAAPSANRFGHVSPTTAAHVREDLGDEVDLILEGGPSEVGIESTIVDLTRERPAVLRPGRISAEQIEAIAGPLAEARGAPRHSGGLARHYAPRTPALLVAPHALDAEIARRGGRIAVLAFSRPDERVAVWLRMPHEPHGYAQRLYAALRELDQAGCEAILVEAPPDTPEWAAVRDRLRRATTAA